MRCIVPASRFPPSKPTLAGRRRCKALEYFTYLDRAAVPPATAIRPTTYAIELAKVLAGLRSLAASIGQQPPISGRPKRLLGQIDRWATELVDDSVWSHCWLLGSEDISAEILDTLSGDLVAAVQSGDYPAGYTELEELIFGNVDRKSGSAEFHVQFTADHPSEDFSFNGHVEGTFHFDPHAKSKEIFLASLELSEAQEHFDMGDPDDD